MITVGVGASSGVSAAEVLAAVDAVLPPGAAPVRLSTLDARLRERGLQEAAARRGWPLVGHPASALARVPVPTPSDQVAAAVGTGSVAEAAALLDGGPLVVRKTVHGRVTVAVAVSGQVREQRSEGTSEERTDRGGGLDMGARSGAHPGSEPWTP
ncbi:cobalamin biosynthesis protein [Blastococcus saxobsidens]|uniref:Cobalamin biosynthesis protein CbiG n=1 Tax=Blastococcus saxobsidens (strain DD2) TaxID=1146883 RepID=H6RWX6_BLASD|nr:cobalamin biosynthesis protein [Blastococcus saxobsidens]CCG02188.1 Cobalamin biosynthesis protein CbiG [Blastococcus saxobsidens DD2]